jgi:hypothetical protein
MWTPRTLLILLVNPWCSTDLSDHRSFVEQLENAFRTSAKVDLCYDFGGHLHIDVPPVPNLPLNVSSASTSCRNEGGSSIGSQLLDVQQPRMFDTATQKTANLNPTLTSSLLRTLLIFLNQIHS